MNLFGMEEPKPEEAEEGCQGCGVGVEAWFRFALS
jgi:hypothetical protein